MKKVPPPASPDVYIAALGGWRRELVDVLRAGVTGVRGFNEVIKWGHIVYTADGPVLLIRAEDERVLFGFWHGQRLRDIEPRLKPGGKYEMATVDFREGDTIKPATVRRLARAALALNQKLGDPALAVKK